MNYLAHTLLSKNTIDYQLANLLADTLKGKAWQGCSQAHLEGLAMHNAIDKFTDANFYFKRAKSRLGNGHLRGVVIDVAFDYFLIKHWTTYVAVDFEYFVENFYQQAAQHTDSLPKIGVDFVEK